MGNCMFKSCNKNKTIQRNPTQHNTTQDTANTQQHTSNKQSTTQTNKRTKPNIFENMQNNT